MCKRYKIKQNASRSVGKKKKKKAKKHGSWERAFVGSGPRVKAWKMCVNRKGEGGKGMYR